MYEINEETLITNLNHLLYGIVDGKIEKKLPYIIGIDSKYKSAILKNNDIVMSKLTPFKICVVHIDDDKEILANGNLFRLTVDPKKMNPVYVMLFLNSNDGQQMFINNVFPKYFNDTAQQAYMESRESFEQMFKDAEKYHVYMNVLSAVVYNELRQNMR